MSVEPVDPVRPSGGPNEAINSFLAAYESQCSILKDDPNATDEYRKGLDDQVDAVRKQCGADESGTDAGNIEVPETDEDAPSPVPVRNASVEPDKPAPAPNSASDTPAPNGPIDETMPSNLPPELQAIWADIVKAAKITGMDPALLGAMIWQESRGQGSANTVNGGNGANDAGLMQVNAATFAELQKLHPELAGLSLSDNFANILAGAFYLKDQQDKFNDIGLALRAYNSGPLSVDVSDANVTTTGLGDPTYVAKVEKFAEDIRNGVALPP